MTDDGPMTALEVLTELLEEDLEGWIYEVKDNEGLGWHGPRVVAWGKACKRAKELVAEAS